MTGIGSNTNSAPRASVLLVGCGNMAGAMLEGWLAGGLEPGRFTVVEPSDKALPEGIAHHRTIPANGKFDAILLGVKPQMLGQPTDEARAAELQASVRERWMGKPHSVGGHPIAAVLDYLEGRLGTHRETLLPRFGIADIAVCAHMGWLEASGLTVDWGRWPKLGRYLEAIRRRHSFVRARGQ